MFLAHFRCTALLLMIIPCVVLFTFYQFPGVKKGAPEKYSVSVNLLHKCTVSQWFNHTSFGLSPHSKRSEGRLAPARGLPGPQLPSHGPGLQRGMGGRGQATLQHLHLQHCTARKYGTVLSQVHQCTTRWRIEFAEKILEKN